MSSSSNSSSAGGGIGITGLLAVAFVVLKLCHVIAWSWWWVLSPLRLGLAPVVAIFAVIGLVALVVRAVKPKPKTRSRY